jgi:CRISPR/Cas system-associated exonuclease Cas4 (RecB family)
MATTQRKGLPYLYVTWLAKRLAGDTQCLFALWFQSRFKFQKVEDPSFDLAAWSAEHDAMVRERADKLRAADYVVKTEAENYFQLQGETAIIAGKMDLVARKANYATVLDGKTGQPRKRDWHQVLIYMAALPILWKTPMRISGEVFYKESAIRIEPEELTQDLKRQIFGLAKQIGTMQSAPPKTPSALECAMCPISKNDCPDRIEDPAEAVSETDLF